MHEKATKLLLKDNSKIKKPEMENRKDLTCSIEKEI